MEQVKNISNEEDMPHLETDNSQTIKCNPIHDNSETDTDTDIDEDEEIQNAEPTNCLFCKQTSSTVEAAIKHVQNVHNVDLTELKCRFQMDQYSFIKLINCIRWESVDAEKLTKAQEAFWLDEKYLKPKEYEPWLSYDYEDLLPRATINSNKIKEQENDLHILVQSLQQKVKDQSLMLEQASEDMAKMRESFQRLVEKDNPEPARQNNGPNCVSNKSLQADESYFSSYAHFGIHHEMLSDVVRTTSYRDALLKNTNFVQGKDVLDVGCGTAVLSIFASQAGAAKVVGIDNSDIIYNAMDIVNKNNIPNVTLVKGRLENTQLPLKKYDIIISEWMGYFLLFEGMLDSVIYARDQYLKEGGMLLPNRCTMSLVGYGSDELYRQQVTFWQDVYGLDMSNMRKEVLHEPLIDVVNADHILTAPNVIVDLNLVTVDLNYSNFSFDLELQCKKDGNLSAFVGYFDTFFDLPTPIMFSTGPTHKPTHWKQVVFFIDKPLVIKSGDIVRGKLICQRSRNDARSLDITIEVFDKKYVYYLN